MPESEGAQVTHEWQFFQLVHPVAASAANLQRHRVPGTESVDFIGQAAHFLHCHQVQDLCHIL
jgi:hypothetical protein